MPTPGPLTAALDRARNFTGGNNDWEPFTHVFDDDRTDTEMVLVPVGAFEMGSPTDEPGRDSDEQPHPQTVRTPYFIDKYEVTNADFAAFLNDVGDSGRFANTDVDYYDEGDSDAQISNSGGTWTVDDGLSNYPVIEVSWYGAQRYCAWRNAQLPTELQWEYAASGPDDWVYPWGDAFDGTRLNYCDRRCELDWADGSVDDGYSRTAPVGAFERGVSWVGAYQMSGNVWEWVGSLYMDYPYVDDGSREDDNSTNVRALRGGSWLIINSFTRAAYRGRVGPGDASSDLGFRCVRSYAH